MPGWPVYSHQFLRLKGDLKVGTWVCPDEMRGLVSSILLSSTQAGSGVLVSLHGTDVLAYNFPAATGTLTLATHLVVYQRQTLKVSTFGAGCYAAVSGSVFVDPTEETGPPGGVVYREARPVAAPRSTS